MRTFLVVADKYPIPEGYDKYIFLYERCLNGITYCQETNKDYCVIQPPYRDGDEFYRINEYISNLVVKVIEQLTPALNEYSDKDYSAHGWGYMLLRDYELVYSILFDLYRRIKFVLDSGISADYHGFCNLDEVFFVDNYDYSKASARDEFYQYLACLLIREMDTSRLLVPIMKWEYPLAKREMINHKAKFKERIFNGFCSVLRMIGKQNEEKIVIMDAYFPRIFIYKLLLLHPGEIGNYLYNYPALYSGMITGNVDYEWRKQVVSCADVASDEFERIALVLSIKLLPMATLENYNKIEKLSRILYKYAENPKAIFFSTSAYYRNECFKSYLMRMNALGKGLFCSTQHGGYGLKIGSGIMLEHRYTDIYYSWGWEEHDYFVCRIKAMPMCKTLCYINKRVKRKDRFLYVDYAYGKYNFAIESACIFYGDTMKEEISFFMNLSDTIKKKIVFRKFPGKFYYLLSILDDKRIQELNLQLDDVSDFYESINQSTIVICASLETTWMEALYFDVPFICFADCRTEVLKVAKADMDKMKEFGIMHESFSSIGKQLEMIQNDVSEWWNQPERKKFVSYLQYKYARWAPDAEAQWMKEIEGYL